MRIEIDRPTKAVNSSVFFQESGFDLICIEDRFYLQCDATEAELLAAYNAHTVTEPKDVTADKAALLVKLGITEAEARLLIGGN